ncbi:hypothetical protein [Phytohabitans rumicis]|uniref:Uncharacterized protein n=1 Tax=Phytohabitans rumicis TaxID=1076125 RepID=A0A6V8L7U9_9ACTN|nr:hypothetical protein [Phytohabitans rumicis]GFJ93332.1 hypothetical protein Prum_069740 [Phytohabitans rumicis]
MFIDSRTVVVCVPAATAVDDLADVAGARLAALGLTPVGPWTISSPSPGLLRAGSSVGSAARHRP